MEVKHKIVKSTLYVGLCGELDASCGEYVRDKMDELFEKKFERVVIDMSGLEFMDSTGIGVLLGRYKKLKARSVPIFLASPKKSVEKVLVLSGLYSIMPKL